MYDFHLRPIPPEPRGAPRTTILNRWVDLVLLWEKILVEKEIWPHLIFEVDKEDA